MRSCEFCGTQIPFNAKHVCPVRLRLTVEVVQPGGEVDQQKWMVGRDAVQSAVSPRGLVDVHLKQLIQTTYDLLGV